MYLFYTWRFAFHHLWMAPKTNCGAVFVVRCSIINLFVYFRIFIQIAFFADSLWIMGLVQWDSDAPLILCRLFFPFPFPFSFPYFFASFCWEWLIFLFDGSSNWWNEYYNHKSNTSSTIESSSMWLKQTFYISNDFAIDWTNHSHRAGLWHR